MILQRFTNLNISRKVHESASADTSVSDNCNHSIPSLSRAQVCQSLTLELYYKNNQLKVTLDTGATAYFITESICRSAGIGILPATQRSIEAGGHSYLPIIGEINIYLHRGEIPPLYLTALVVPKLGCEVLAGMSFIMSKQIIINTPKSVITIHNKYDVNFSSLGHSKSSIIRSPIKRILFSGDCIQAPLPQDFINHYEFSVEPRTKFKVARSINYQK